jgi:hypothetical protein
LAAITAAGGQTHTNMNDLELLNYAEAVKMMKPTIHPKNRALASLKLFATVYLLSVTVSSVFR